jgi:predicted permease
MDIATLITAFIPLAALILLGFILGRALPMDLKTLAGTAIFGFTPIVAFGAAAQLKIDLAILCLPLVTFMLASAVGLSFLALGKAVLKDKSLPYLLPVATGSGNTGYFGLPVALALFGPEAAGVYMLGNLGVTVFETSLGYYFLVRGGLSRKEAVKRALKLPVLYALAAGLLVASLHLQLPASFLKLWDLAKGAYVCVGMMILGVALGQQKKIALSLPLVSIALIGKFIAWPLLVLAFIAFDETVLHAFTPLIHNAIILISLVPMAANLAAYAAQNNMRVDQAAGLILLSTIIAIIFLPFVLPLLLRQ